MNKNNWIGQTIGEVLEECQTGPYRLRYIDEPPGKLRAVEITCEVNNEKQKVLLEIEYNSNLFSADRNWSLDLIKKQKVMKVHPADKPFLL